MWFRYNASRSGVMVPPLGSGGAADRRVTNHDGWEFNGLPTIHTPGLDRNKLRGWRGGQPWWRKREGFWLFPCLFFSDTDKNIKSEHKPVMIKWLMGQIWTLIRDSNSKESRLSAAFASCEINITVLHTRPFNISAFLTLILGKCRSEYEKGGRDAVHARSMCRHQECGMGRN